MTDKIAKDDLTQKVRNVYEDDHLLILCKKPLLHSVAVTNSNKDSVADWISRFYPSLANSSPNPGDAGLVNRLDYSTSGLLMAAKTRKIWHGLFELQKAESIQKEYIALCQGKIEDNLFEIETGLVQSADGKRMLPAVPDKKYKSKVFPAKTIVRLIKQIAGDSEPTSLVRLRGTSFRRHQLRVHLSSIGHPLVGDELYGAQTSLRGTLGREGFFLHSFSLGFEHPTTKEYLRIEKPSEELPIADV